MKGWEKFNLACLAYYARVNMNVLPRINFLFQVIPLILPDIKSEHMAKAINDLTLSGMMKTQDLVNH